MPIRFDPREYASLAIYLLKWIVLTLPVGIAVGAACAFFLWALDLATQTRWDHPELLYLLPVAGGAIGATYFAFGKSVAASNSLIVDEIHEPGGGVPLRMAPLVLVGTIVTHLFGGSAGREGTAVQMGGAIASGLARLLPRLTKDDVRTLLMTGVAAGFAGAGEGEPTRRGGRSRLEDDRHEQAPHFRHGQRNQLEPLFFRTRATL